MSVDPQIKCWLEHYHLERHEDDPVRAEVLGAAEGIRSAHASIPVGLSVREWFELDLVMSSLHVAWQRTKPSELTAAEEAAGRERVAAYHAQLDEQSRRDGRIKPDGSYKPIGRGMFG